MNKRSKSLKWLQRTIVIIVCMSLFFWWQNNGITVTKIEVNNENIPSNFEGYTIVQVSDLHNKEFGNDQYKLLEKIKKIKPDMIVVTGDLIDSNRTNIQIAIDFIDGASELAPIYYVTGNHEAASGVYQELKSKLVEYRVNVLEDDKIYIHRGEQKLSLIGLQDTSFGGVDKMKQVLTNELVDEEEYTIVLSHRPEYFPIYAESKVDLVFSGHAHGGQVRIPFIGGVIAPGQGFFPKLTEGIHHNGDTSMIISRGLGNSIIPVRIFNRPELVVVTLGRKEDDISALVL